MTTAVALYMRSSKDKNEVSIAAQRRELTEYAKREKWQVAKEYEDVEVSGSLDEISRPGLQAMLYALSRGDRGWDTLLLLDTSRLARDESVSLYVRRECEKAGVQIVYAKAPVDAATAYGEMILGVMRTFDRLHSRVSAERGRKGQEENLANGWRAGGIAPKGYKLQHEATGAKRSGKPVMKSKLVLDPKTAPLVKSFLKARAKGTPRTEAAVKAGLALQAATLIGIERNALKYAGYEVWNQRKKHKPTREDPRKTMLWRPRSEWIISERPMYPALITRAEAETILAALASRAKARGRMAGETAKPKEFVLSGILQTPDGAKMHGERNFYRAAGKGKRILRSAVDKLVLETMAAELQDSEWIGQAVRSAHEMAATMQDNSPAIEAAIRSINAKIARLTDLVAETGNASLVAKLEDLERQREAFQAELGAGADRAKLKARLEAITPQAVRAMLDFFPISPKTKPEAIRRTILSLVRTITLDWDTRTVRIDYLLPLAPRRTNKWDGHGRWEVAKENPTARSGSVGFGAGVP